MAHIPTFNFGVAPFIFSLAGKSLLIFGPEQSTTSRANIHVYLTSLHYQHKGPLNCYQPKQTESRTMELPSSLIQISNIRLKGPASIKPNNPCIPKWERIPFEIRESIFKYTDFKDIAYSNMHIRMMKRERFCRLSLLHCEHYLFHTRTPCNILAQ